MGYVKCKKHIINIMEPMESILGVSLPVPSVQELTKEPLTRVPPRYIRPDQDSRIISSPPSSRPQVPIIDMERLLSQYSDHSEVEKLHLACRDWGFFQVYSSHTLTHVTRKFISDKYYVQLINHEVSYSLLEKLKEETQQFFRLPLEEKNKYAQRPGVGEGFGQSFVMSDEQKLDWCDIFRVVTQPSELRKPHLLPKLPHTQVISSILSSHTISTYVDVTSLIFLFISNGEIIYCLVFIYNYLYLYLYNNTMNQIDTCTIDKI